MIKYLIKRSYKGVERYYWSPKKMYLRLGIWTPCPWLKPVRLSDNKAAAIKEAEDYNAKLAIWREGEDEIRLGAKGSFDWLIAEYRKSAWFKKLGDRTRKEYGYVLDSIRERLQATNAINGIAAQLTRQHARAFVHYFESTPRKAQLVAAISRIVFNYGIEIGLLNDNPFKEMRIRKRPPRELIWLDLEHANPMHIIETLKQKALDKGLRSVALAIDIALYTAQRQGDILALPWGKYDGSLIKLRQSKTRAWVEVPVMPQLKKSLDTADKKSPVMLISERTGNPYTKDHFGDVFREIRQEAKIDQALQYRDLRKTAIVMLALAGCTDTEITAISGHTNSEVSDILETYLPRNSLMAKHAVDKLKVYLNGKS